MKITGSGAWALALGAALLGAAWVTGDEVTWGLAALMIAAWVAQMWGGTPRTMSLERRLPRDVFAGRWAQGEISLRVAARVRGAVRVEEDEVAVRVEAPTRAGAVLVFPASWRFERRGIVALRGATVVFSGPFGWTSRSVPVNAQREVAVAPAPKFAGLPVESAEIELSGLQPFFEGMSESRIHWSTTARQGRRWAMDWSAIEDGLSWVWVDERTGEGWEEALRAAAGAVLLGRARGQRVGLILGGTRVGPEDDPLLALARAEAR